MRGLEDAMSAILKVCAVGFTALLIWQTAVLAQPVVRVDFTAVIYEIYDPFFYAPPTWTVGDTLVGFYEYELGATDAEPDPAEGRYQYLSPPSGLMVTSKGFTYTTSTSTRNVIVSTYDSLGDSVSFWDTFRFHSQSNTLQPLVLGVGSGPIALEFVDSTGLALPNDSLPSMPPPLGAWTYHAKLAIHGEVTYWINADLISMMLSTPTSISEARPPAAELRHSYPNPFEAATSIWFEVSRSSHVRVVVYDVVGREVATLTDSPLSAGDYVVPWDGLDRSGQPVASGIYFYRLQAGGFSQTRKMVIVR